MDIINVKEQINTLTYEVPMKYLFKSLFLLYIITRLALSGRVSYMELAIILILTATNIIKEKYYNSIVVTAVEFVIIAFACTYNTSFILLLGIIAEEVFYHKAYIGILPVIVFSFYFLKLEEVSQFLLIIGVCCILGHLYRNFEDKEKIFIQSYDKERHYSYELEQAKAKLLNSTSEAAHVAEVRERNRIAREIHDNVGHSIAGILLQLQASYKLFDRDEDKSRELLNKSIGELSSSLTLLRDTVHNIKPNESLGIEYIKRIIDNFNFCSVDFQYTGDFNTLSASQLEMLHTNIKEALTNTSKHSNATRVEISIDMNDKFIRLYIKDNGTGCENIKEGLGLSGMKERIRNIGGSISISSDRGFIIVCVIPKGIREGGGIFEGIDSRR